MKLNLEFFMWLYSEHFVKNQIERRMNKPQLNHAGYMKFIAH